MPDIGSFSSFQAAAGRPALGERGNDRPAAFAWICNRLFVIHADVKAGAKGRCGLPRTADGNVVECLANL
jgi:hypothetical protein